MIVHGCASETSTKAVDDALDLDDDEDKRDRDDDDENKAECPIGTTAYDFWSGEYPGVVVQVDKTSTLMAKTNVCDSEPSIQCTISPGLYHPWATQNLGTAFKTISKVNRYRATKPFILEADEGPSPEYKTGTIITENMYLSEGYCVVTVDETMYHWVPCPEADGFELLPNPAEGFETREFIGFKCLEGQVGWFETGPALFQNPGIQTGEITGYGEIGKAGESEFGGI